MLASCRGLAPEAAMGLNRDMHLANNNANNNNRTLRRVGD